MTDRRLEIVTPDTHLVPKMEPTHLLPKLAHLHEEMTVRIWMTGRRLEVVALGTHLVTKIRDLQVVRTARLIPCLRNGVNPVEFQVYERARLRCACAITCVIGARVGRGLGAPEHPPRAHSLPRNNG